MKKRIGTLLVLVLVFALVISGCGETTTPEKVDNNDQGQENENQQPAEKFNVGDTVKMGDLHFTLKGVRFSKGDEYWKPEKGKKWIVFDCTLENVGSESESISSLMMFNVYDPEGYQQDIAFPDDLKGSLDGELGAGRKMSGEVAFEVDAEETSWEFIFEPNVFGFGQAIFDISVDEVN